MKKALSLITLAACALSASAHLITPAEALSRINDGTRALRRIAAQQTGEIRTIKAPKASDAALYLVSNPGGMMILTADSEAQPLVGWSDEPVAGEIPPALQFMLDCYAAEVEQLRAGQVLVTANAPAEDFEPISPICSTKWNQGAPYNNLCPTLNNQPTVTGCLATAMAQVLKTYNYPEKGGGGTYSYAWGAGNETLKFNYSGTTFQWDLMKDSYTTSAKGDAVDAVATLMYACGVACNMNFTNGASGANSNQMAVGLVRNFRYNSELKIHSRGWYTLPQWQQLIYDVLKEGHAVFYSGQNADATAGHAFVVDGYSHDGFFHLNWGWGGMSDGYYRLSALDPAAQGIGGGTDGYNYSQGIFTNLICKAGTSGTNRAQDFTLVLTFQITSGPTELGQPINLVGGMCNYAPVTSHSFTPSMIIEDKDGNRTYVKGNQTYGGAPTNAGLQAWTVNLPSELADGDYIIRPAVWDENKSQWVDVHVDLGGKGYNLATVKDGKVDFALPEASSVKVEGLTLGDPDIYRSVYFPVSCTLTNTSSTEPFWGGLRGQLQDLEGKEVETYPRTKVDVEPGETIDFTYSPRAGKSVEAGEYQFVFINDDGVAVCDPVKVKMSDAAATGGKLKVLNLTCTNANRNRLTFELEVECTEGYYTDPIYLYVTNKTVNQSARCSLNTDPVFLKAGDKMTVTLFGVVDSAVKAGRTYYGWPHYWDSDLKKITAMADATGCAFDLEDDPEPEDGIAEIEAGSRGAQLYDLQGRRVSVPGHGIYLLRQGNKVTKIKL